MKYKISNFNHIYRPEGNLPWGRTHAQVPFATRLDNGRVRVYFSTRDEHSQSSVSFVELDGKDLTKVLYVNSEPCFSMGERGSFDETGTMPSWFIQDEDSWLLYYTGWNRSETAAYRLAIGLAKSTDGGLTFSRVYKGPVLERGHNDPVWVGQPCVLKENGIWKMWYLSCQKVDELQDRPEPFYNVRYAESLDGEHWEKKEVTCIDFDDNTDAIGRPCVWKHKGFYFMLHSNRLAEGYRSEPNAGYRICLSKSQDGLNWIKQDTFEIPKHENSWMSVMHEYTTIIEGDKEGEFVVFHNGNGFGETGFGCFKLTIE